MVKKLGVNMGTISGLKPINDESLKQSDKEGESMSLFVDFIITDPNQPRQWGRILPEEIIAHRKGEIDLTSDEDKRKVSNFEFLSNLSASIKENGLAQPIVVKKVEGEYYQIVAGERRFLAHLLADFKNIRTIIRATGHSSFKLSLAENIQREDLCLADLITSLIKLCDKYDIKSASQLMDTIHKPRRTCERYIRFTKLKKSVLEKINNGEITKQDDLEQLLKCDNKRNTEEKVNEQGKKKRKFFVGRQRTSIQLGHNISVKNGFIVKKVIEKITRIESINFENFENVDWNDLKQAQDAWNKILETLIAEEM